MDTFDSQYLKILWKVAKHNPSLLQVPQKLLIYGLYHHSCYGHCSFKELRLLSIGLRWLISSRLMLVHIIWLSLWSLFSGAFEKDIMLWFLKTEISYYQVLEEALSYFNEVLSSNDESSTFERPIVKHDNPTWDTPPLGFVKKNFDGSVDSRKKCGAIVTIIRDPSSDPLGWSCKRFPGVLDPLILKALAARKVAFLAKEQNFHNVIMEGDSLSTIKALQGDNCCISIRCCIQNAIQLFSPLVLFNHVNRNKNMTIHFLAKQCLCNDSFYYNLLTQCNLIISSMSI